MKMKYIDRDRDYEEELIALERDFWENHILTGTPPPYTEEDVYPPQRIFPTLDFWLTYRKNRLSRKNQFLRWKHLV